MFPGARDEEPGAGTCGCMGVAGSTESVGEEAGARSRVEEARPESRTPGASRIGDVAHVDWCTGEFGGDGDRPRAGEGEAAADGDNTRSEVNRCPESASGSLWSAPVVL